MRKSCSLSYRTCAQQHLCTSFSLFDQASPGPYAVPPQAARWTVQTKFGLGREDSNLHLRLQRPACYRCTTPQTQNILTDTPSLRKPRGTAIIIPDEVIT